MGLSQTCILQNITGLTRFQSWEKRCFPLLKDSATEGGPLAARAQCLSCLLLVLRFFCFVFFFLYTLAARMLFLETFDVLKDNMVTDVFCTVTTVTTLTLTHPFVHKCFRGITMYKTYNGKYFIPNQSKYNNY